MNGDHLYTVREACRALRKISRLARIHVPVSHLCADISGSHVATGRRIGGCLTVTRTQAIEMVGDIYRCLLPTERLMMSLDPEKAKGFTGSVFIGQTA